MRHIVESIASEYPKSAVAPMHRIEPASTPALAGRARLRTFAKKLPRTRAVLGSSARTKLGNPMQKKFMSVIVIGWKG